MNMVIEMRLIIVLKLRLPKPTAYDQADDTRYRW